VAFEALRAWRLTRARADGVAPYVVFHDAVLRDIAASRPATLVALGRVQGVGAAKLERYGRDVLDVLGDLAQDQA
jgi:ATP-dependent DNA helicase RecQ